MNVDDICCHCIEVFSLYILALAPKSYVYHPCKLCVLFALIKNMVSIGMHVSLNDFMTPLTHWGRVTHTCISKITIIGSDNGLLPGQHQAII